MVSGTSEKNTGRIRLGMVGGGQGAFIGAVHRLAARMDDHYDFVAGALSAEAKKAKASGEELGLAAERIYTDFKEMAKSEAGRKDGIEAVAIVTPNHMHVPAAMAFIEHGIHVICDKPLALTLKEAKALEKLLARKKNVIFALTHNYSGYPMIRQAKAMVAAGELGEIRVVQGEYPQDWLTTALEKTGQKQAAWRTDPKRSGAGGCIGDIGTHTYQLLRKGPGAGRQRQCHVALQGRRQGHALGQPGGAGQRERPEDPRLWHQGRTRVEAGRSQPALVHALWRAEAPDHPRRRGIECGGGSRHARPAGPSGRLSGRLRQRLFGSGQGHQGAPPWPKARQGRGLPRHRRWRGRHGLHRGLREVLGEKRQVDKALTRSVR
jgi:predicted dehydrogenase